jgi:class 3 adenylate cyclase/tetratricopeptide (TPR) repeat protein
MSAICPHCAEPNREGARFCDQCGTQLPDISPGSQPERTIELRQGTVLFCDLVQSTRLANSLDVDDLRNVFRGFRQIVVDVVGRHSGHLIQFSGDGAFMLFGYPKAREDAAESAVHAGITLVEKIRQVSTVSGSTLDLRVGIASGPVVTGDLEREANSVQESVIGSIVHLAARLVAKASPGRVVIDDATRDLTGRFFEYRDLGRLRLKGFDDRVQAWQVLRPSAVASRFEAKHADHLSPFVGRAEPLALLRDAWNRALASEGSTIVLTGDAGIGKSRLAREVRREALEAGATVLDIDCSERSANTPLAPVATLLRHLVGGLSRDSDVVAARVRAWLSDVLGAAAAHLAFPYLASLLGLKTAPADAAESPERFRERLIGLLVDVVRALAERQPLFVFYEDAHWSDPTTLELVATVSAQQAELRILTLITSRPAHGQARAIQIPDAQAIVLTPLESADAARVVRLTAAMRPLPADIVTQIVTRCDGNPLYLEEATHTVLETAGDRGVEESQAALRNVPTSLQGLVQARLDLLPHLKPVIQAASVVGRDVPVSVLELVLPERRDVGEAMALLADRELLVRDRERQAESFRFKHALIHDAVYRTMVRSERQRLHSRTADVLAQHFAGQAESAPDVLAPHFVAAQRHDEAAAALADASDLAAARGAYAESIAHSRGALSSNAHAADERARRQVQRRVLIRLGVALAALEGYASERVLQTYHDARSWCGAQDEPAELFPVVRGLGTFYFVRGDLVEADALSEQCLTLARQSGRPDFLIEALSFRGYPAHYRGRLREARASLEECLAVYRAERGEQFVYPSAQDAATAARSLLITTMWLQGDTASIERTIVELLDHVQRLQRPFDEAYARVWIAGVRHLQRRFPEALEQANLAMRISQEHGYHTWLAASVMMGTMATALSSDAPEPLQILRTTHEAFRQAGANASASFYLWGIARALDRRGERERAREVLQEASRIAELSGEHYMNAELLAVGAELEVDDARAVEGLQSALRLAEEQGAFILAVRAAASLVKRLHQGDYPDESARTVAMALEGAGPYPMDADWPTRALGSLKQLLAMAGHASTGAVNRPGGR